MLLLHAGCACMGTDQHMMMCRRLLLHTPAWVHCMGSACWQRLAHCLQKCCAGSMDVGSKEGWYTVCVHTGRWAAAWKAWRRSNGEATVHACAHCSMGSCMEGACSQQWQLSKYARTAQLCCMETMDRQQR
jgi:hypothetical protein